MFQHNPLAWEGLIKSKDDWLRIRPDTAGNDYANIMTTPAAQTNGSRTARGWANV
jgi:hypothetical protein